MSYKLFLCYITSVIFLFIITKQNFNRVTAVLFIIIYGACQLFVNSIFVTINMVSFNSELSCAVPLNATGLNMPCLLKKKVIFFLKEKTNLRNVRLRNVWLKEYSSATCVLCCLSFYMSAIRKVLIRLAPAKKSYVMASWKWKHC